MPDTPISMGPWPVSNASDFGRMIRGRRWMLGLTQEDAAMQSGVSLPTISAIENGNETEQLGLVLSICHDLGLRITIEA